MTFTDDAFFFLFLFFFPLPYLTDLQIELAISFVLLAFLSACERECSLARTSC